MKKHIWWGFVALVLAVVMPLPQYLDLEPFRGDYLVYPTYFKNLKQGGGIMYSTRTGDIYYWYSEDKKWVKIPLPWEQPQEEQLQE